MGHKVGLISLGCAKNRVDSEIMLAKLKNAGYCLASDVLDSDVVIVNTCAFIEDAKTESIEEILNVARLKKLKHVKCIVVTGCLAERYKSQVADELPEVDAVVGIGSNDDIVSIVDDVMHGKKVQSYSDKNKLPLDGDRIVSTSARCAYLKVADGCSNCCTYCAIPLIRGEFRSRKMEDVLKEASVLAGRGIKELLIIAQDTTRYGEDLYGKLVLPELLRKLCKIDGIEWIRVLYCYPERITDELIDVIAKENKIVKYIDVPLQHCNGRILNKMNRRGDTSKIKELVHKIRTRIENVVIRTSFIVGFPSETDEEFCELAKFCKDMKFERVGCFTYSQEEDTPAALLDSQIDDDVKLERQKIIMEQQMTIMEDFAINMIGKEVTVLVEGVDETGFFYGRSYVDAPEVDCKVFFTCDIDTPKEGDFVKVKVERNIQCDLFGIRI